MYRIILILLAILLWSGRSPAQVVALTIVTDPSGITLTGSGTAAVTLSFGTVQAFGGTVPSGITRTTGTNSWTLTTPIDLTVTQVGVSTSYSLTAQLTLSDAQNTWKVNSVTLSTAAGTITASHGYGTAAYTLSLTVPFSAAAGSIMNTVDLIVTAN